MSLIRVQFLAGKLRKVLLVTINSKDKLSTVLAVRQAINEGQESYGWFDKAGYEIGNVIDSFAERHAPIKPHFFTGTSVNLQNIDSLIAEYVIQELAKRDAVVVCVHDSFIVNAKNIGILKKVMDDGYRKVVNEIAIEPKAIHVGGAGMNVKWYEPMSRRSYGVADWIDMHLNIPFMDINRCWKATQINRIVARNYYITDD